MNSAAFLHHVSVRFLSSLITPSPQQNKLLVLFYHQVLKEADPILYDEPDAEIFDWQMEVISKHFNVLPLAEAYGLMTRGQLPRRAICVTFDDGYANNFDVAYPILKKWNIPATFFIAVGFLDGGRMWNDTVIESIRRAEPGYLDFGKFGLSGYEISDESQRLDVIRKILGELKYLPARERMHKVESIAEYIGKDLPDHLMMRSEQVIELRKGGMDIGAHTVNHPILARLSQEEAEDEVISGRNYLKELLDEQITSFAYPNGVPGKDYTELHVDIVRRAGFRFAVSTAWGCATDRVDGYQLPRIGSWDRTPGWFSARLLRTYLDRNILAV